MAEALGVAASVISVASIAIQLGDSLKKAYSFWESIKDGPADIKGVPSELRLLAGVLTLIRRDFEGGSEESAEEVLVKDALKLAKDGIDSLALIITELSSSIAPGQK